MTKTEQIARDFLASGEEFNYQTLADRYGMSLDEASQVITNFIRMKKYHVDVRRNGHLIEAVRVLNVTGKDSTYLRIRAALEASGEAFSPPDLVKQFGINYHTAAHILFKLRKDPHVNTEVVQKGKALAVRIKTEPLSTEAKLWWVLTTKPWNEIKRIAA